MNRREFIQSLGILGAVAATPKFIFDVGANLYKQKDEILKPEDYGWFYVKPELDHEASVKEMKMVFKSRMYYMKYTDQVYAYTNPIQGVVGGIYRG